jgi:hypothetical protein
MKTVQQIIDDTLKIENHDERYLYGRFKGFYRGNQYIGFPMGKELLTCEDFPKAAGCCDDCHTFYIVYEMDLVETPRGWAWLCCGVRSKVFPRDYSKEPMTESEKMLEKIFGSGKMIPKRQGMGE